MLCVKIRRFLQFSRETAFRLAASSASFHPQLSFFTFYNQTKGGLDQFVFNIAVEKKTRGGCAVCAVWHDEHWYDKLIDHTQGECHEERQYMPALAMALKLWAEQSSPLQVCHVGSESPSAACSIPTLGTPRGEVGPVAAESRDPLVRCAGHDTGVLSAVDQWVLTITTLPVPTACTGIN